MRICKNCGAEVQEGHLFCAQCGAPVEDPQPAAAEPAAAAAETAEEVQTPAEGPAVQEAAAAETPASEPEGSAAAAQTAEPAPERPTATPAQPAPQYQPNYAAYQQSQNAQPAPMQTSEDLKPISMWGYLGYQLLFGIPCIGLIFLCIFSFGGTKNVHLKNFARSYFCMALLGVIFFLLIMAVGAAAGLFEELLSLF